MSLGGVARRQVDDQCADGHGDVIGVLSSEELFQNARDERLLFVFELHQEVRGVFVAP